MTDNALAQYTTPQMEKARTFFYSPMVREQFEDVAGPNAGRYLNQVLSLVAQDKNLQECSLTSIMVSAIRAATLRLSVDKSQGQAWIIPYKGQATFVIGARGFYQLAMRTNKYRYLNVFKVYEGQQIDEDQITGLMKITGARKSNTIIGYGLAFELYSGFVKMFYMTVEELDDHAKRYSQSYNHSTSPWKDPREKPKMMEATVMRLGLKKYGVFNEDDQDVIEKIAQEDSNDLEAMPEDNMIDMGAPVVIETKPIEQQTSELGYGANIAPETKKSNPVLDNPSDVKTYSDAVLGKIADTYGKKPVDVKVVLTLGKAINPGSDVTTICTWMDAYMQAREAGDGAVTAAQVADDHIRQMAVMSNQPALMGEQE